MKESRTFSWMLSMAYVARLDCHRWRYPYSCSVCTGRTVGNIKVQAIPDKPHYRSADHRVTVVHRNVMEEKFLDAGEWSLASWRGLGLIVEV